MARRASRRRSTRSRVGYRSNPGRNQRPMRSRRVSRGGRFGARSSAGRVQTVRIVVQQPSQPVANDNLPIGMRPAEDPKKAKF